MSQQPLDAFLCMQPSGRAHQEPASGSPRAAQGKGPLGGSPPARQLNIRPSMEARRRRLDLSALQASSAFQLNCSSDALLSKLCCNGPLGTL